MEIEIDKAEAAMEALVRAQGATLQGTSPVIEHASVGAWQNTTDPINQIDLIASVADTFKAGTRVVLLGEGGS